MLLNINDFRFSSESAGHRFFTELLEDKPYYDFVNSVLNNNFIEINRIINRYYYDSEFLKAFNKRLLKACTEVIGCKIQPLSKTKIEEIKKFYLDSDTAFIIDNFFKPSMVSNSLFDIDFEDLRSDINMYFYEAFDQRHLVFMELYKREAPLLIDKANRSKEIDTFEKLLREYLTIKEIDICPSGLVLREVLTESARSKEHLKSYKMHENIIDLSILSSGEKKIILMLALAIFTDDLVLLFDEPELSLSLIWQEKLIPDMLNFTNVKKIIVATHSPYIASDESLTPYIAYLPSGEDI